MVSISFIDSLRIAFDALRANKLRAVLTTLGVVVGIMLVTLMGWALNGLDRSWEQTIDILGADMLYVDKWDWAGGKNWRKTQGRKNISLEQSQLAIDAIRSAELVTPMSSWWGRTLTYNGYKVNGITVTGVRSNYAQTPAGTVNDGRFFSSSEDQYSDNVVVIGYNVASVFFREKNPIGEIIKIGGIPFRVIGTIEKRGTAFLSFVDNQVFIPLNSFFGLYGKSARSISIAVKAGSVENLDYTRQEVLGAMRSIRNLQPEDEEDFSINETQMFREQIASIRIGVWAVGLGLTALSFIVGVIGIMNIMLVAVTERTKEIGIRKALGAKRRSILFQFLVEASLLCFLGALLSIILCSGIVAVVAVVFKEQAPFLSPYIPIEILIIAIVVSIIVGVIAGLLPAIRAAYMRPVDALRYE